jgi:hypothetical protein
VLRFRRIVSRYIRTWFVVDAVILSVDWISVCLESLSGDGGVTSTTKILRILKMSRFVRLIKALKTRRVSKIGERLLDQVSALGVLEYLQIFMHVLGLVGVGMLVNHWSGCVYFYIGRQQSSDKDVTWLRIYIPSDPSFVD